MSTPAERLDTLRRGQFADDLISKPEYVELLIAVKDQILLAWSATKPDEFTLREQQYAKWHALGMVNSTLAHWKDLGRAEQIQMEQEAEEDAPENGTTGIVF